ncbi:MAG: HAD family hydrolase [Oscillospiraceae bacterium]|nr:HAD family hydrolase [Oscillospiraceae bacterium]
MLKYSKPKMIIFDYGHTLVYEDKWDGTRGMEVVLKHAVSNKSGATAEQLAALSNNLFGVTTQMARKHGVEAHEHKVQNLLYEYMQVKIDLSPDKIEKIYWDNAAPAHAMPHIGEVLDYLRLVGIRTAVISNISFSGAALRQRIDSVLPGNSFEFAVASSEYVVRKPNKMIFELALRKAGLDAADAWYCGDSVDYDIIGAHSVGIFPVWYESEIECWYRERGGQIKPDYDHLHIRDWRELIEALQKL